MTREAVTIPYAYCCEAYFDLREDWQDRPSKDFVALTNQCTFRGYPPLSLRTLACGKRRDGRMARITMMANERMADLAGLDLQDVVNECETVNFYDFGCILSKHPEYPDLLG